MGVAIVNEHGEAALGGDPQLSLEGGALHLRRRQVPEEVKADLPHRHASRVADQRLELTPRVLVGRGGVVGMQPDGSLHERRMALGQLERGLRRGQVPAGHQDPFDAGRHRPLEHGIAVRVKALVLEMAVRVDEPRQPRGAIASAQTAASASMRGKMGTAAPVNVAPPAPPHSSRPSRPGPPAPRSS